jgi:putative ATPase
MIKSIRGSDVDAGLYYLARLINGGEPAEFIARRLAILASEDIGNANPHALNLASSTLNIVKMIGYPEARISLSQLVIYLASSPKSNRAYLAINEALSVIQQGEIYPIPLIIKQDKVDYLCPHNYGGWVEQEYMSRKMKFYESSNIGFEKTLNEWISKIKNK